MRTLFFIFAIVICLTKINAQEKDFNLWTALDLETHLSKHLDMVITVSNRWNENVTRRDESLIEAGLDYSRKWFSSGITYRLEDKSDKDEGFNIGHRIFAWAGAEAEAGRFSFSFRNKFQTEYLAVNSSESGHNPEYSNRNRIKADYNIRKLPLKPYLSYEIFSCVDSYHRLITEKYRIAGGVGYKINKKNSFGISYFYDHQMNVTCPCTNYILTTTYVLELN